MKRELITALVGASLLVPMDAAAQRGSGRVDDGRRVEKLDPITVGGRVGHRARPAVARSGYVRSRVVYSSGPRYRGPRYFRPGRIAGSYRDARIRVRLDWGRAPIRIRGRVHVDRRLGPGQLRQMLGHATVARILDAGRRAGLRGAPRGHWVETRRYGRVLVVTMDRTDVAEFIDYDRDGWIDDAFVVGHDRGRRWIARP